MIIQDYYYNDEKEILLIEFSTNKDGDDFYRRLELQIDKIQYYSPTIVDVYDLKNLDKDFIIDLIEEYLKENDLPEQLNL
jgi:hypothetical protein